MRKYGKFFVVFVAIGLHRLKFSRLLKTFSNESSNTQFEYFCWQLGSTVAKKGCKLVRERKMETISTIPINQDLFSLQNNSSHMVKTKDLSTSLSLGPVEKSLVRIDSNKSDFEDSFKSIHYYIVVGVIIVLLAFTTATVVSYRYSKRQEKTPDPITPDPITVEESVGEPEELGAKKFKRVLSGMFDIIF